MHLEKSSTKKDELSGDYLEEDEKDVIIKYYETGCRLRRFLPVEAVQWIIYLSFLLFL